MVLETVALAALGFALGLKWPKEPTPRDRARQQNRERLRQWYLHTLMQQQQVRPLAMRALVMECSHSPAAG